jgi:hypothetical protein
VCRPERESWRGQREPGLDEAVIAEKRHGGERSVDLVQGVGMPAVEQADLLSELPRLEPERSRQADPIEIGLLDGEAAVTVLLLSLALQLEAGDLELFLVGDEDLGPRVRIQR